MFLTEMVEKEQKPATQETQEQHFYPYRHGLLSPEFFKVKFHPPSSFTLRTPTAVSSFPPVAQADARMPQLSVVQKGTDEGLHWGTSSLVPSWENQETSSSFHVATSDSEIQVREPQFASSTGRPLQLESEYYNSAGRRDLDNRNVVSLAAPSQTHKQPIATRAVGPPLLAMGDTDKVQVLGRQSDLEEVDTHDLLLLPEKQIPHSPQQPSLKQARRPKTGESSGTHPQSPKPQHHPKGRLLQEASRSGVHGEPMKLLRSTKGGQSKHGSQPTLSSTFLDRNLWQADSEAHLKTSECSFAMTPEQSIVMEQKKIAKALEQVIRQKSLSPSGSTLSGLGLEGGMIEGATNSHLSSSQPVVAGPLGSQVVRLPHPSPLQQVSHASWIGVRPTYSGPRAPPSTARLPAPPTKWSSDIDSHSDSTSELPVQVTTQLSTHQVTLSSGNTMPLPKLIPSMVPILTSPVVGHDRAQQQESEEMPKAGHLGEPTPSFPDLVAAHPLPAGLAVALNNLDDSDDEEEAADKDIRGQVILGPVTDWSPLEIPQPSFGDPPQGVVSSRLPRAPHVVESSELSPLHLATTLRFPQASKFHRECRP